MGEKEKWVSNVTPRIFGDLSRGKGVLFKEMLGTRRDWWLSGVKRGTEDFWGAMERPLYIRFTNAMSSDMLNYAYQRHVWLSP